MHDLPEDKVSEVALGPTIKSLRLDCELTQAKFAEALGVTTLSVNRYEAGTTKPSLETIAKLHRFAVEHKHGPAAYIFSRVIAPRDNVIFELGMALGRSSGAALQGYAVGLSDEQIILVLALERLLADKSNQTKMVYDILQVLLSPYLGEAEDIIKSAAATRTSGKVKPSRAR